MTNIIRMQGPANCGGFSHGGASYEADENGVVEVPSEIASFARAHGFMVATAAPAPRKLEKPALTSGLEKAETPAKQEPAKPDAEEKSEPEQKGKLSLGKLAAK